ncbi:unnamed protein product [Cladocopium goreaui]|uniref:ATP-grasp domain-containing protein n=1 Tax=Cladocopium goreaui TaxID=2562237 RepID=A0A9P1DF08_9DINO|nr:unnamed protein product [Cladocopium goreaui]
MVTGTQAPRPQELGKKHQELETNTELVVAQALTGGAGCFNGDRPTDSDNVFYAAPNKSETAGWHFLSRMRKCHGADSAEAWYGPPKFVSGAGPQHFVYNVQYLAGESPRFLEVVEMVKSSLTALGLREGAAHTELVWVEKPYIYEVNARCSGGLPRVPPPTQLDALAMSLFDEQTFLSLPDWPSGDMMNRAAVVFLISPIAGWITQAALESLAALKTFLRFERGLAACSAPFRSLPVSQTTGLFSSPGAVLLTGDAADVLQDVQMVREVEKTAYVETIHKPPLAQSL